MDVSVNGVVVSAGRSFAGTGSWGTRANSTLTVSLAAGSNTIRVTAPPPLVARRLAVRPPTMMC